MEIEELQTWNESSNLIKFNTIESAQGPLYSIQLYNFNNLWYYI